MSFCGILIDRARNWFGGRHAVYKVALVVTALCTPGLFSGLVNDDFFIKAVVLQAADIACAPSRFIDAYSFLSGDAGSIRKGKDAGLYPWWTHPQRKNAFFRPLAAFIHYLDFRFLGDRIWLMHLHSILWYGALVLAAGLLYRRLLLPGWSVALAALFYGLDYGHAFGASVLNCRNSVMAALFCTLTILAHDCWRRRGSKSAGILASVFFILGLLSGEAAVATGAYLFAYGLFLDSGSLPRRMLALAPCALITICWWLLYNHFGYGTTYSGIYIHPGTNLVLFLSQLAPRLTVLIFGQLAFPSDIWGVLPQGMGRIYAGFALAGSIIILWALQPLLARDRAARFFACGMILSAIPFCANLPTNRLVLFTGIGAMGLVARFVTAYCTWPDWDKPLLSSARSVLAWGWGIFFLAISPALFAGLIVLGPFFSQKSLTLAADTIVAAQDESPPKQTVIVNVPFDLMLLWIPYVRTESGRSTGLPLFLLTAGYQPVSLERLDERTVLVGMQQGLLKGLWNQYFRDPAASIAENVTMRHAGVDITVTRVTPEGLPCEIRYCFSNNIENGALKWVTWSDKGFVPVSLPQPGERITVRPSL